jgi:hypothetical protein
VGTAQRAFAHPTTHYQIGLLRPSNNVVFALKIA